MALHAENSLTGPLAPHFLAENIFISPKSHHLHENKGSAPKKKARWKPSKAILNPPQTHREPIQSGFPALNPIANWRIYNQTIPTFKDSRDR
jgi:hypothetical protein